MQSKHTKRALLTSVLAMLVCVAMLVGSTFAWFTDSVTSGRNQIVAGNLDVEVYTGDELTDRVNEYTILFDGIIWEPGVVAYENFRVFNEGSLAFDYLFSMNAYAFNTVDGSKSLKDVIKIAVVEDSTFEQADGRETVLAAAEGKFNSFEGYAYEGYLETTGSSKNFAVVLYWEPSSQDNDYNLNNGKTADDGSDALYLEFGMNLTATQRTYEYDSFGNTYDEDARWTSVATEAELRAAIENGGYIRLVNNIALSEELYLLNIPALVINGNGFAITAADGFDINSYGQYHLVKIESSNPVSLQNIALEHKLLDQNIGSYHTLDIYGSPAVTLSNVTLTRNIESTRGGAAMVLNGSTVTVTDDFTVTTGGSAWGGVNVDGKNGSSVLDVTDAAVTYSGNGAFAYTENGGKILYDPEKYIRTDLGENYAVSPAAANVNGTVYATLTDAINAANDGDTIVLANDVNTDGSVCFNGTKNLTLDLNDNTLDTTNVIVEKLDSDGVNATITIQNGTITASADNDFAPIDIYDDTGSVEVIITDVTVEAAGDGGDPAIIFTNGGKPTLNNVTVNGSILVNTVPDGITINGGTFTAKANDSYVLESNTGATINGGTFTATGDQVIFAVSWQENSAFVIEDGIFNYEVAKPIKMNTTTGGPAGFVYINGGTFNGVAYQADMYDKYV